MSTEPRRITSRDNPLLQRLRRLVQDGAAYRRLGSAWLEGEHLGLALAARGRRAEEAVLSESGWRDERLRRLAALGDRVSVVPDALFASASTLETPARIGFLVPVAGDAAEAADTALRPGVPTVVLDRLQDAGNVGSILRSAAALGVAQVVALRGTAALWSPKVLRAGMGAHLALHLVEQAQDDALDALAVPLVATSSHGGTLLPAAPLARPCAWVFGHEGQGVGATLMARCALTVRIPQPGGEESLNVAAAAAICLYESARRQVAGGG
jgi:TrmH family RNA methyltransferase